MSSRKKIEKWLLADWSTGNNNIGVVDGDIMKVAPLLPSEENDTEGMVYERPVMEQQRLTKANESGSREESVPREGSDYSPSCSSWAPSDDESSSDESDNEKETRTIKMDQYVGHCAKRRNGKNVPVPVHRPNAVVNVLKERQNNTNNRVNHQSRKRKYKETRVGNKSLPDSTKKHLPPPKTSVDTISINKKNILDMKASFDELFKIIDNMKPESERQTSQYFDINTTVEQRVLKNEDTRNTPVYSTQAYEESEKSQSEESNRSDDNVLISNKYSKVREIADQRHQTGNQQQNAVHEEVDEWVTMMKPESERQTSQYFDINTTVEQRVLKNEDTRNTPVYSTQAYEESEKSQSEESNRSDDNVLISNKYSKVREIADQRHQTGNQQQNAVHEEVDEWVPIGSGKTLIHKDKFSRVNWRSYTIATRTLLLATFPRRILATHSLTGKRSPAFQDKPAKMCLDPKIVSDIIIEITSKFNVKENLVRSAITTKCADECKMLKTRIKNKNKTRKNQENTPPPTTEPRQFKSEKPSQENKT